MTEDLFLTTEEVMEYLQVNLRTVYRLIRAGLPAVRVGRLWRVRKKDVDAWLANGGARGKSRTGEGPPSRPGRGRREAGQGPARQDAFHE
jgi:excisionase family DNA binding protein